MDSTHADEQSYVCPQCGVMAEVSLCRNCGRGVVPELLELAEVDGALQLRQQEAGRLEQQLSEVASQIGSLRKRRNGLATELTRMRHEAQKAAAKATATRTARPGEHPIPVAAGRPESVTAQLPNPATGAGQPNRIENDTADTLEMATQQASDSGERRPPAPDRRPHPGPDMATAPVPQPVPNRPAATVPEASTRSVQNVLLSLGGVLSAAAIIVFTAVAWATFGAPGRAAILTTITVAMMLVPLWIMRRGLTATAETVSGLAILMIPCDAMALYLLNIFPSATSEPVTAEPATRDFGGSFISAFTTGIHTPGIGVGLLAVTAIALGYRVLTRMIVPGYAVAAFGVVTLGMATVQFSTGLGTALLLASAGLQALATWVIGRFPAHRGKTAARILTQTCASLTAITLLVAVLFGVGRNFPGYTLLAFAALAALLLAVSRRLPAEWRTGPLWTVRVALLASAAVTIALSLFIVLGSLLSAWRAATTVPDWPLEPGLPFGWRLTGTVLVLTVAGAGQLTGRRRYGLSIFGGVVAIMTLPSALGLPWTMSSLLLGVITVVVVAAAAAARDSELSRALLISALPLGLMAVALGLGGPGTTVTVLCGFAVCLGIMAPLPCLRGRMAEGGLLAGSALWSAMAAFPVACHLFGLSVTRVSALSGILAATVALLGAFVVTRDASAKQRRFASYAGIGLAVGIGTLSVTALATATAVPGPPFVVVSAVVALPLFMLAAGFAFKATVFRGPASPASLADGNPRFEPSNGHAPPDVRQRPGRVTTTASADPADHGGPADHTPGARQPATPAAGQHPHRPTTTIHTGHGEPGNHRGHYAESPTRETQHPTTTIHTGHGERHPEASSGQPVTNGHSDPADHAGRYPAPGQPWQHPTATGHSDPTGHGEQPDEPSAGQRPGHPVTTGHGGEDPGVSDGRRNRRPVANAGVGPAGQRGRRPRPYATSDRETRVAAAGPDADTLTLARRVSTGLATAALLIAVGALISMLSAADTLPGFVIVPLVAALLARLVPAQFGYGPARGSWAVGGVAGGVAGLAALSTVPVLFGFAAPLPWLDWRTPLLLAAIGLAGLALLPSGWRISTAAGAATLGALAVPVAWGLPWWSGPALYGGLAAAYGLWSVFVPRFGSDNELQDAGTRPHDRADELRDGDGRARGRDDEARPHSQGGTEHRAAEGRARGRDDELQDAGTRPHDRGDDAHWAVGTAWLRGVVSLIFAGYGLVIAATHPDAPSRQAGYAATALLGLALLAVCVLIAALAYRRMRPVGGVAVAVGLTLMPVSTVMGGLAARLPAETIQISAMTTACMGLLVAAALRLIANRYLPWATIVVPPIAAACARGGLPSEQSPMYIAIAGLIGVGAAMLMLPNRTAATIRTALSSVAVISTMVKVLPLSIVTLALPYTWVRAVWSRTPADTIGGLTPWDWAPPTVTAATGWDLAVLVIGMATIVLAVFGLAGRGWAVGTGFVALAIAIPAVPVVFDLPWPSLPFVALAIAVAAYVLSTHLRFPTHQLAILAVVAVVCVGAGMTGSLASRSTTLVALIVISVGTLAGGLLGVNPPRRSIGWLLSSVALSGLVTAAAYAAGLPGSRVAFGAVMIAGLFLALASARTQITGASTWAAEAGGHGAAAYAILVASLSAAAGDSTVTPPAVVLVIYGALLGLLAVRAGSA
ncbi:MAG: hypothetical protein ACRD0P_04185, partial [Stackebrandtia sp.]